MRLRQAPSLAALAALLSVAGSASAHPVTVDGSAVEWSNRTPNVDNLALIARDATKAGEYVWRDVIGDARTDLANPELIAEISGVQITGTPNGFGVLVRNVPGGVVVGKPIQIQLAIDLDRVAGSGMDFLAGFADTKVSNNARWEFLVQTLFGSGGQATVLNPLFMSVSAAQAAQGANGVELFVPWSALGLLGPPSGPLRLTLATFRAEANDNTVDIGGAAVSNVVDAVTDYGDPRAAAYPNTFQEVQDGTIDYSFDVFFNAQGEVYSPLVAQRFMTAPSAGSSEWVALKNVSPVALPLGVFKLGDEETPDQAEGMRLFPVAATLSAGSTYVVAASALQYQTTYGTLPDAEFGATVIAVPKMTAFAVWSGGAVGFNNPGDELLVLDGSNTIVDLVVYGNGVYAGIVSKTPTPGADVVLTRDASSSDTDDCQVDFTAAVSCANDAACGSSCKQCLGNICVNKAIMTSCADATVCNGAETCDGAGVCSAGAPLDCDDAKVCTTDSCDAALGCLHANLPAATSCSDGNVCNGLEECDGSGACLTAVPGVCDDGNPCTADSCAPMGGCMFTPLPAGTSCDADADPCNGGATCDGAGSCAPQGAPSCDDSNPCTTDACVAGSGCLSTPLAANTSCSDGDACNGDELCDGAGTCDPGVPVDCDDGDPCTVDSCTGGAGCASVPAAQGASCADGDACNGAETCDAAGVCQPGAAIDCDDGKDCTTDGCDPASGCVNDPLAMGTACAEDPLCSGQTCDANGTCQGGSCGGSGGMGTGGSAGGSGGSAGGSGGSAGGTGGTGGGAGGDGNTGGGATGGNGGSGGAIKEPGGCGCRLGGEEPTDGRWGALLALAGLALRRRMRRGRPS